MIKVIDNFLEDQHFKKIQEHFLSSTIPWYWMDQDVPLEDEQKNLSKNGFFNHCILNVVSENNAKITPIIHSLITT